MPKILLTRQFSDKPPVNRDKPKIDYFDSQIPGFLLEVRIHDSTQRRSIDRQDAAPGGGTCCTSAAISD